MLLDFICCNNRPEKFAKMKAEKKLGSAKKQQSQQQNTSAAVAAPSADSESPTGPSPQRPVKQPPIQYKQMFSEPALRNNFQVLEQSRTCQSAVSGIASGILGLTGTLGFLFYFLTIFIQAFVWDYKAGFQWANYFQTRWLLVTHSLVGGLFTYVLFWVFVYGLVHVY